MKSLISVVLILSALLSGRASAELALPAYSQGYDPARDAIADAYAAKVLAQETGRKVYIVIGGEWCSWCRRFDRMLKDNPGLTRTFSERFVMLKVNVSEENDNATLISGLPPFEGYPHFFVASSDEIILSISPSEFLQQGKFSAERFGRFVDEVGAADYQPIHD